jgi:ribosomal protein L11 methyltransferase
MQVSLEVDGELAEAVAEVFARFVFNGVAIESTAIEDDPGGPGKVAGPLRVVGFLLVDEKLEETCYRLKEALWYLGRISPLPTPQFTPISLEDWSQSWKRHFRPIKVGRRLLILPPWANVPVGERVQLIIDPGMAFGTGTHPTTRLCLEALEHWTPAGGTLIDVGCGSGVLALAALKLGAARAYGVDTDPDAIAAAEKNAEINGLSERMILGLGSVDTVRGGNLPIRNAPLVVANILASVIVRLLDQGLVDLMDKGGVLILSGILDEQEAQVRLAIEAQKLRVIERRSSKDWLAFVTRKEP